ncbi:MAG: general secretion pathway protein GspD [Rhodocyclaceae bacterium]|nr:MAG: general secretion pathway protein GspD [Rhodocyclaceae bacterium]
MTLIAALAVTLTLAGCAGQKLNREGKSLLEAGKVEEGLDRLAKAVEAEPSNAEFRKDLYLSQSALVTQWLVSAQQARAAGQGDEAEALYKRVLTIDKANLQARDGLTGLVRDRRHGEAVAAAKEALAASDVERATALLRPVLAENPDFAAARELKRDIEELQLKHQSLEPSLRSSNSRPVNLELRDANVRMIFDVLSRDTGINFILDKDVRPDLRTTIFLRNAFIEDAIDLVLQTSQLQKKILNSKTVLIYPNTPEKQKEYQDLMVKAFYLQNADVKQIQTTLKTLLKTKDIVVDEKLNLIVIRDSPEAIRLAEKLVALHDIAEPEVMLEVEVLEVQRDDLLKLGIQWPNQLTLSPLAGSGGSLTLDTLRHLNSTKIGATISATTINLRQDNNFTNLLANPRIRVRNHEKAKIMIGDKVPVITTTTTATGLVSDNVQYLDVGLKLNVEPDIHLQDDVAIKIGLEVSSITSQTTTNNGTVTYQIGTRNADTVLRLRDGETQILAGLINDSDRKAASGVPGLASMPVLGRLFSSQQDQRTKTEIVLSITPHLVRNIVRPDAMSGEFWSGTETNLRTKPLNLNPPAPKPSDASAGPAPATGADGVGGGNVDPSAPVGPAKNISLNWQGPKDVKQGDTVKLVLRLKTDGNIRSLPFQVGYDPAAFQVVEISEGGFFKQDGGTTNFSNNVDSASGKFFVSVTRTDVAGTSGEDAVATVTLRALVAKSPTELKLLNAAPIVQGEASPRVLLPPPYGVTINP